MHPWVFEAVSLPEKNLNGGAILHLMGAILHNNSAQYNRSTIHVGNSRVMVCVYLNVL